LKIFTALMTLLSTAALKGITTPAKDGVLRMGQMKEALEMMKESKTSTDRKEVRPGDAECMSAFCDDTEAIYDDVYIYEDLKKPEKSTHRMQAVEIN